MNLSVIDVSIIGLYLALCMYFGLRKSNRVNSLKEYAIGSGNISSFALIATIIATHIGAGDTIGRVEKIYSLGLLYAIPYFISPLFWLITAKIFGNIIEKFQGCISLTDIMAPLQK